jgi:ParB family chromosome partitioning protein
MAKRRRLTPARTGYLAPGHPAQAAPAAAALPVLRGPEPAGAPIARIACEASTAAALAEVAGMLGAARAEGRLVQRLARAAIEIDHLVRDRLDSDEEALRGLMGSIATHGQRMPIEVAEIAPGRYGLISGWRRLTALARLEAETGEARFAEVLALVRQPAGAAEAYVAMVEENEVRLGLSYYERARIAARAVDIGVFGTEKAALQTLFASASRARRSKIGSFLRLYRALDGALRFPAAIPERLGLALAKRIEGDPACAAALRADLAARPAATLAEEVGRLTAATAPPRAATPAAEDAPEGRTEPRPGVFLTVSGGWTQPVLTLAGPGVDPAFRERLEAWLQNG